MSGHIELVLGCMFSRKTTYLLTLYEKYKHVEVEKRIAIVSNAKDTRYAEKEETASIASHHRGLKLRSTHTCYALKDIESDLMGYDVVMIDEGHLFSDIESVSRRLATKGVCVVISALDTDFMMETFHNISSIAAEKIKKLHGKCWFCGEKAAFSVKTSGNSCEQIQIGGAEMYKAACQMKHNTYNEAA